MKPLPVILALLSLSRFSAELSRGIQISLGWRLATAPDIAHSDTDMAPFFAKVLFPD